MDTLDLEVVRRSETGKNVAGRMRREGFIPAVIYSDGESAFHLTVSDHAFRKAAKGRSDTQIFKLKSNDVELDGMLALVREVQMEPIKDRIQHVDFLRIQEGRRVPVTVPIKLVGEIESVKLGLAFTQQVLYKLKIECFPNSIPAALIADVSQIRPGHALNACDIPLPEGAKLSSSANTTVMSVFAKNKAAAEELEQKKESAAPAKAQAKSAPATKAAPAKSPTKSAAKPKPATKK